MAMLSQIARELDRIQPEKLCLLSGGVGDAGIFLLTGPEDRVTQVAAVTVAALNGRGGGRGRRHQGKTACPQRVSEIAASLDEMESRHE